MKTLENHLILYDAECPMCKLYTKAFISSGMLEETGRAAYQQIPAQVCPAIDLQRAANEIALVDTQSGEVSYGIKSLFKVIGYSFPVMGPLFRFAPFVWLMSKVYAFVSYNRRVIIPAATADSFAVQPAFRLRYRIAYLLFTGLVVGLVLTGYNRLFAGLVPAGNSYREYLVCGGQLLFQGAIISFYAPGKRWDYLGNMMTISFAGSLLLLPVMFLSRFLSVPPLVCVLYFLLVAGLMFLEHIRRTKLMELGWLLSITWTLYRILVLLLIFL